MLAERIYTLRKQHALSQEQLAEALGVSRQTVSKWENGTATPELEKLRALARCFGVTLDELVEDGEPAPERKSAPLKGGRLGLALCLLGALGLFAVGGVMLFMPGRAEARNAASAVAINGSGIALFLCAAVMCLGLWLTLRRK